MKSTLYRRGSDGKHAAIFEDTFDDFTSVNAASAESGIDEFDVLFDTGVPITTAPTPATPFRFRDALPSPRIESFTGSITKLKGRVMSVASSTPLNLSTTKTEMEATDRDASLSELNAEDRVTKVPAKGTPQVKKKRGPIRKVILGLEIIVASYLIFYICLGVWTAKSIQTTNALPHHHIADTPGENWLLVGSDSRRGLSFQDMKELHTGMDHSSQRTDTIMIVHFGGKGPATLVSLPRDSYVTIPMHKNNGKVIRPYRDKINSAFAIRPSLLVSTVEYNTGLHIDHYMQVGFGGIRDLTDALSGVRMCVPQNYVDIKSGLNVKKGCQNLDGKTALAYVRMRYVDPRGDIGRIERQQEYLGAVLNKATSPGMLLNPFAMIALSRATTKSLTLGHGDGVMDLGKLGLAMGKVMTGEGTVRTVPLSSTNATTSAGSSVLWNQKYAKALFRKLGAR